MKYQYHAPVAGYYHVSSVVYHYRPTGKYETIKNPKYRWYKPWVEKYITREIYEMIADNTGVEIRRYMAGELIVSDIPPNILST